VSERRIRFTSDGDIIREAREARGWTREQLGAFTGTSVALIARFETEPDYTPMRERF
jgi:ribosome-binding protein aMBF1 (putative translation factor)